MAAWCGLEAAGLKAGETVVRSAPGAASAVPRRRSPSASAPGVIGSDRHAPHPDAPIHGIAEKLILGAERSAGPSPCGDRRQGRRCRLRPGRRDYVPATPSTAWPSAADWLRSPRPVGREVSFDLADFYHNESRLYGVDTLKRDLTASAAVLEALLRQGLSREIIAPRQLRKHIRPWRSAKGLSHGGGRLSRPGGTAATAGIEEIADRGWRTAEWMERPANSAISSDLPMISVPRGL